MKKKTMLLFVATVSILLGPMPVEAKRATTLAIAKGEAIVNLIEGPVEILEAGEGAWKPLKIKDSLEEGDEVRTGKVARIELLMTDSSRARFAENSAFKIARLDMGGASKPRDVKIHLALGKAWSNVAQKVGVKGNFSISCDNAVAGVRGTVYRMDVEKDRSALVRVYDGTVHVTGGGTTPDRKGAVGAPSRVEGPKSIPGPHRVTMEEWTIIVKSMQQVMIGADGSAQKPKDFTVEEDRGAWVDWNRLRDR